MPDGIVTICVNVSFDVEVIDDSGARIITVTLSSPVLPRRGDTLNIRANTVGRVTVIEVVHEYRTDAKDPNIVSLYKLWVKAIVQRT